MRDYELMVIIRPNIADEDLTQVTDRIGQWVTNSGGQLVSSTPWGRRRLAFPLNEHREGTYMLCRLQMSPTATVELERNLRISDDVLRHLLLRPEH